MHVPCATGKLEFWRKQSRSAFQRTLTDQKVVDFAVELIIAVAVSQAKWSRSREKLGICSCLITPSARRIATVQVLPSTTHNFGW